MPSHKQLKPNCQQQGLDLEFYDEKYKLLHLTMKLTDSKMVRIISLMPWHEILTLLHARPSLKGKTTILVTRNQEASKIVNFMHEPIWN